MTELVELLRSLWVVWLMALFIGIAVWAFWPRNRKRFERYGEIPLRDDVPQRSDARPERKGERD